MTRCNYADPKSISDGTPGKKPPKEPSEAYVIDWFPGYLSQRSLIQSEIAPARVPFKALAHLTAATLARRSNAYDEERSDFVPVPWEIWRKHLGGKSSWQKLSASGHIVEILPCKIPYMSHNGWRVGKCREFRLSSDWLLRFVSAGVEGMRSGQQLINIFTGQDTRKRLKTRLNDADGHDLLRPGVGLDALRALTNPDTLESGRTRCPLNLDRLIDLCERLGRIASAHPDDMRTRSMAISAGHLLLNLQISDLQPDIGYGESIHSFQPAYDVLSSGRLMTAKGGLQMAPRVVRQACFEGIEGIVNVDMVGAQAAAIDRLCSAINMRAIRLLRYHDALTWSEQKELKIPREFTERWARNSKKVRQDIAEETGLDCDIVKKITFIIAFGGSWRSAVFDALLEHHQGDERAAGASQERLGRSDSIRSLRKAMNRLRIAVEDIMGRPWLWDEILDQKKRQIMRAVRNQHGVSIINAVGASLQVADGKGNPRLRPDGVQVEARHVAAHLAQGLEQEFMSHFRLGILRDGDSKRTGLRYCLDAFDGAVLHFDTTKASQEEALAIIKSLSDKAQRDSIIANASRIIPKSIAGDGEYESFLRLLEQASP